MPAFKKGTKIHVDESDVNYRQLEVEAVLTV